MISGVATKAGSDSAGIGAAGAAGALTGASAAGDARGAS
jgi:hypothetical protein